MGLTDLVKIKKMLVRYFSDGEQKFANKVVKHRRKIKEEIDEKTEGGADPTEAAIEVMISRMAIYETIIEMGKEVFNEARK